MDKQPLPGHGHCGHCSGVVTAEDLWLLPGLGVARGTGSLRKVEGNPFLVCVTGISPCTSALIFSCPYLRCFALICLCLFPLSPNWCPPLVPRPVITPAPPCSLFLLCSHPTAETTRTRTQAANRKEDDAISGAAGATKAGLGTCWCISAVVQLLLPLVLKIIPLLEYRREFIPGSVLPHQFTVCTQPALQIPALCILQPMQESQGTRFP